ncbi:hypothetical protein MMC25_000332 [Agyrium rufum]|nr:hypothetical protein [Agyrium rufum]
MSSFDERIIINAVDAVAQNAPDSVYASYASSIDLSKGYRHITYRQYADAINSAATWLETQLGESSKGQVIPYIGPSDLRYPILTLAALKAGCVMLFLSPRNTHEGQMNLVDGAKCHVFLTGAICPPAVEAVIQARRLRHLVVPELEQLLDGPKVPFRPMSSQTLDEIAHLPIVLLHSSGTTGLPRPIPITHGCYVAELSLLSYDRERYGPTLVQRIADSEVFLNTFPLFHRGGLWFALTPPLGIRNVIPPTGQPLTADLVASMIGYEGIGMAGILPSLLEEMSKDPAMLRSLSTLKNVLTGGAPLAREVGDKIQNSGPRLYNLMASTETGVLPILDVAKEDWQCVRFAPGTGVELRPQADGMFELFIVRDDEILHLQPVFWNYPNMEEWPTQDLFRQHPSPDKVDLWMPCGRTDDMIVLSNGEKFDPTVLERVIESHSLVTAALIYGRNRFQSSMLVELKDMKSEHSHHSYIEQLTPAIQEANGFAPAHGKISRTMVAFTQPSKPMVRTAKGNINRNATWELYKDNIDRLYEQRLRAKESRSNQPSRANRMKSRIEAIASKEGSGPTDSSKLSTSLLRRFVQQIEPKIGRIIKENDNFFDLGMDSLQVLFLSHNINSLPNQEPIKPSLIYANPSLASLYAALKTSPVDSPGLFNRFDEMQRMLETYTADMPARKAPRKKVVMLTGATGCLGSHLLPVLSADPQYTKIYCLVRTLPPADADVCMLPDSDDAAAESSSKTIYLKVDFADPLLGLSYEIYTHLLQTTTHILHNAWTVNFNLPLAFFETQVRGVRHFIDFAARSTQHAHLFFVSSTAAVTHSTVDPVPEQIFDDPGVADDTGYGASKHIAERLLYEAGARSGVASTVCRVGQIAGPVTTPGEWAPREWIPSMVRTASVLRCLPTELGSVSGVDWVPVDIAARIIIDLLDSADMGSEPADSPTRVLHLQNPHPIAWPDLLPSICKELESSGNQGPIEQVSFREWIERLRIAAQDPSNLTELPAARLMGLFERMAKRGAVKFPSLAVDAAATRSKTLEKLEPVGERWMTGWLRQWGF